MEKFACIFQRLTRTVKHWAWHRKSAGCIQFWNIKNYKNSRDCEMNEINTMLLEGFYSRKISMGEVKERFSLEGKSQCEFIHDLLIEARDKKDPDLLEDGITLIFIFKEVYYPIKELNELLLESWHYKHEDIASLLQDAKSPTSIDALNKAVMTKFDYLDFDDAYALAVKCIWALGGIGTSEAKDKLTEFSKSDNRVIKENAIKQLKRHNLL